MSQTPLPGHDSAIWFVSSQPLFIIGLVFIALALIFSVALAWSWSTLQDEKRTFRENQAAYEQQLQDGHYLKLSPHGLLSEEIELAYTQTMPFHCLMCDRSFLMMTYHIYRLKKQPMSMFIFSSHYCKEAERRTTEEMRTIADDFNQAEQVYLNHLSNLAPLPTQVMSRIAR